MYEDIIEVSNKYCKVLLKAEKLLTDLRRDSRGFCWCGSLYFEANRYLRYSNSLNSKDVFSFVMDSEDDPINSGDSKILYLPRSEVWHSPVFKETQTMYGVTFSIPIYMNLNAYPEASTVITEEELFQMNTVLDDVSLVHHCVQRMHFENLGSQYFTYFVSPFLSTEDELKNLLVLEDNIDTFAKALRTGYDDRNN